MNRLALFLLLFASNSANCGEFSLGIGYWAPSQRQASLTGYDFIETAAVAKAIVFANIRSSGFQSFPNFHLGWTPLVAESKDEIPVTTLKSTLYDVTWFFEVAPRTELGLTGRLIDIEAVQDFKTSVNTLRYKTPIPMLFLAKAFELDNPFYLRVDTRFFPGRDSSLYYDVAASLLWVPSKTIKLSAGYRVNYIKINNPDFKATIHADGFFGELQFVF